MSSLNFGRKFRRIFSAGALAAPPIRRKYDLRPQILLLVPVVRGQGNYLTFARPPLGVGVRDCPLTSGCWVSGLELLSVVEFEESPPLFLQFGRGKIEGFEVDIRGR